MGKKTARRYAVYVPIHTTQWSAKAGCNNGACCQTTQAGNQLQPPPRTPLHLHLSALTRILDPCPPVILAVSALVSRDDKHYYGTYGIQMEGHNAINQHSTKLLHCLSCCLQPLCNYFRCCCCTGTTPNTSSSSSTKDQRLPSRQWCLNPSAAY